MAGAERRCPRKAKYKGNVMESQEQRAADSPNAGDEPNPATQSIDVAEVARADVRPSGAAASKHPPQIPLAPMKRMQARFNPLADGLMYLVVFVGGFVGVGFRRATDLLLPSVNGSPFVVGTFVSNMLACFLFAMLTEYMATASWLRRRVRQVVSRGVGLGLLGGLSTMSGVMLETMEGMREQRFGSALGYLAGSFAGGLIAAAVGVALMQALLARGTRKRVRNAIADASTASVSSMSDSGASDAYGIVQDVQMTDTAVSATQSVTQTVPMADSGESDVPAAQNVQNNVPAAQGVRHVKVADAAHSAAQAAVEAAGGTAGGPGRPAGRADRAGAENRIAAAVIATRRTSAQLRTQAGHRGNPARRRPDHRGGALMTWMICLFGGIGAMARYVLDVSIQRSWNRDGNHSFPLATLVINGVASLCAGIAMMSYYAQSVDMGTVMTFVVGFLGGFSTFSSAINEVLSLIRKRRFAMALGYGAATVAVPLACVALGFGIAMLGGHA